MILYLINKANSDVTVECIRHFTSLATMSSLMRMKSRCWWGSTPKALWMLCRSAAMSGTVDDSAQRWLHLMEKSQTQIHGVKQITSHYWSFTLLFKIMRLAGRISLFGKRKRRRIQQGCNILIKSDKKRQHTTGFYFKEIDHFYLSKNVSQFPQRS